MLTKSPDPFPSLQVCGWIPIGVINDDAISSSQVHTQSTHLCGQQEQRDVTGIELVDEDGALSHRGCAVHA